MKHNRTLIESRGTEPIATFNLPLLLDMEYDMEYGIRDRTHIQSSVEVRKVK